MELIRSEFTLSLSPPAILVTCEWGCGSLRCFSSALVDPEALTISEFWSVTERRVEEWFKVKRRQNGEIVCLPTYQSTSKPLVSILCGQTNTDRRA